MKVAIVGGSSKILVRFRGKLVEELKLAGCDVLAFCPESDTDRAAEIEAIGAKFVPYTLDRAGLNPVSDLATYRSLVNRMTEEQPDVVLGFMAKPVIYGSLAASKCGVPRVLSLITGLGYSFCGDSLKQRLSRAIQLCLFRRAFAGNDLVIFQNRDDRRYLEGKRVVSARQSRVVDGSGVDLEQFRERPLSTRPFVFLLVARLLREKGIMEYCEAAARVKQATDREVRFCLVGGEDSNPSSISKQDLERMVGPVEVLGERSDVASLVADCSCFVLPSYYREGVPRSVLEALATGRPVITTDAIGCRETVIDGENGWLVPVRDPEALAEAMLRMINLPRARVEAMAAASRRLAEERFDVNIINRQMMAYIMDRE